MNTIISIIFSIIVAYVFWYCFENYNAKVAFVADFVIVLIQSFISNGTSFWFATVIGALIVAGLNTLIYRFVYKRTNSFWQFFIASILLGILLGFVLAFLIAIPVSIMTIQGSGLLG